MVAELQMFGESFVPKLEKYFLKAWVQVDLPLSLYHVHTRQWKVASTPEC